MKGQLHFRGAASGNDARPGRYESGIFGRQQWHFLLPPPRLANGIRLKAVQPPAGRGAAVGLLGQAGQVSLKVDGKVAPHHVSEPFKAAAVPIHLPGEFGKRQVPAKTDPGSAGNGHVPVVVKTPDELQLPDFIFREAARAGGFCNGVYGSGGK
ncbi:hypothetical protein ES703_88822 [subsurface metagenome]